jgi:RNA polymerase sigma-70 factor (ECF subfamily)
MVPLPDTRYSLLTRLAEPHDFAAWVEFLETYEGAVLRYCRSRGLQESDARDVVQEVLLAVHHAVNDWRPTGREGSFRNWLLRTTHNLCLKSLRGQTRRDRALGGSGEILNSLTARSDQVSENDEWRRWAFFWAAEQVEREILPVTWQAFVLTAVRGEPPTEVARRLNLRVGSVYAAKCRVLSRIRERIQALTRDDR